MWQWGGDLATPRELLPASDGSIAVRCPDEVLSQHALDAGAVTEIHPETALGAWSWSAGRALCSVVDRLGIAWLPPAEDPCLLEAEVTFAPGTQRIGFLLRAKPDLSEGYALRLEPETSRVVLDYWPRPGHVAASLSRYLPLQPGRPIRCRVLLSNSVAEAFIDDRIVLTARVSPPEARRSAIMVQDGSGSFEELAQRPRRPPA
jgi:beta-fructofuranosidase